MGGSVPSIVVAGPVHVEADTGTFVWYRPYRYPIKIVNPSFDIFPWNQQLHFTSELIDRSVGRFDRASASAASSRHRWLDLSAVQSRPRHRHNGQHNTERRHVARLSNHSGFVAEILGASRKAIKGQPRTVLVQSEMMQAAIDSGALGLRQVEQPSSASLCAGRAKWADHPPFSPPFSAARVHHGRKSDKWFV